MRKPEQIVARIRDADGFFGFAAEVLVNYLPWALAKEFIKEEAHEKWEKVWDTTEYKKPTRENVLPPMQDYMEFALGKAEDHRGISAGRSINKLSVWGWLLCDDELMKAIEEAEYENYGVPKLKAICDHMGWPFPDEEWAQNMAAGKPCYPYCDNGCGR